MIGDHPHDVEMAKNVGARGIYLLTGHGKKHRHELLSGVLVAENMKEAIRMILEEGPQSQQETTRIRQAAEIIARGGIVAFPTETVYGLGANAFHPLAVARIFDVKQSPSFDPLIVHIAQPADLEKIVSDIPSVAGKLMERFWPGPLTLVLPKRQEVPDLVTAGLPTVAVRMPSHAVALELIELAGCPIAAPSANPFGYLGARPRLSMFGNNWATKLISSWTGALVKWVWNPPSCLFQEEAPASETAAGSRLRRLNRSLERWILVPLKH